MTGAHGSFRVAISVLLIWRSGVDLFGRLLVSETFCTLLFCPSMLTFGARISV